MKRWGKNEAPGSSDISKCDSDDCPAKMDCHRYLVKPASIGQSYIIWQPGEPEGYDCHLYMPEEARCARTVNERRN